MSKVPLSSALVWAIYKLGHIGQHVARALLQSLVLQFERRRYRGTSLTRKRIPLKPYRGFMPRVPGGF